MKVAGEDKLIERKELIAWLDGKEGEINYIIHRILVIVNQ